mgnify:FL=1
MLSEENLRDIVEKVITELERNEDRESEIKHNE